MPRVRTFSRGHDHPRGRWMQERFLRAARDTAQIGLAHDVVSMRALLGPLPFAAAVPPPGQRRSRQVDRRLRRIHPLRAIRFVPAVGSRPRRLICTDGDGLLNDPPG